MVAGLLLVCSTPPRNMQNQKTIAAPLLLLLDGASSDVAKLPARGTLPPRFSRVSAPRTLRNGDAVLPDASVLPRLTLDPQTLFFPNKQEKARREREELDKMLEENRRRVEEAQRREALELQRKEEERHRELELIQRQKEEAARRKKLEDEQELIKLSTKLKSR
ncbi:hypothetical protein E3N88_13875 [Mikania micrantha]|uniref:Uncharacterized protein n=1 Tax=Mikania micrantha TaxID=192012 RepID=A0A5N6P2X0_9ASTR|nr:hypothetical protein E3N88_13875 [Mikania micrantha]